MEIAVKVVGIGLSKTGTTSLGVCLRHWGLKHISYERQMVELWHKGEIEALMQCVEKHESFEDWPWPLIYKEIDQEFSSTKFVLTRRKSADVWFRSYCKHADRGGDPEVRKLIYGHRWPHKHKAEHVRFYENHLQSVREHFADRPDDLLEVCWEEGHGWRELADYLGFECPDTPFPHANKSR